MGKSLSQSRTFWVNAFIVVGAALTGIMGTDVIASNPGLIAVFGSILGIVNIVLRLVTKEPIK